MPDKIAFFDTSAIVPLCATQLTSQKARQAYRSFTRQVVSWTTLIEATGAIYRAVRVGGLSQPNANRALGRLAQSDTPGKAGGLVSGAASKAVALPTLIFDNQSLGCQVN